MKKHLSIILLIVAGAWLIRSTVLKLSSVFNDVPANIHALEVYEKELHYINDNLDPMTFEEYKRREKQRLRYEIKGVEIIKKTIKKMDDLNQLEK